jgi:hypothetical protein
LDQLAGSDNAFGAVGAPDRYPAEGPEAHCDNADFLNTGSYFRNRSASNKPLFDCVLHAQTRLGEGLDAAAALLDSNDHVIGNLFDISTKACEFGPVPGRAKCTVIEGFGRALHTVQDFYAHSNWVDIIQPPYSLLHPPGLAKFGPSHILDLRRDFGRTKPQVDDDFTTGCFNANWLATGLADHFVGTGVCTDRITHATMNKDHGVIDPETGFVSYVDPSAPRGVENDNFPRAVRGAIDETVRQWKDFRSDLRDRYGPRRANLMICAITRDNPSKDCNGRKIGIVIDSSGSNTVTDPSNLRIFAAQAYNSQLVTLANAGPNTAPDRVTVIDFDDSARVIYPLGDPEHATFAGIDSSGGTYIAGGLKLAIDELTKDEQDPTRDRTGVIVLTDGEDYDPLALIAQLARAKLLGIRVDFGILSPSAPPLILTPFRRSSEPVLTRREPSIDLIAAILSTGGFYSTINSAEAQQTFIDLVIANGATNLDDGFGANDGGPLLSGLTVTALASASSASDVFSYHALPGQHLEFKVQSLANQLLNLTLHDVRRAEDINSTATDASGKALMTITAQVETEYELIVFTDDPNEGVNSVALNMTQIPDFVASPPTSNTTTSTCSSRRRHKGMLLLPPIFACV